MNNEADTVTRFQYDDVAIHYEEIGAGEPLLLLPGLAGSVDEFVELRELLHRMGFRVIAADLPGSGKSLPQPRAYHVDYHAEDAQRLLALLKELGTVPAHVVGFSDGGDVALLMAVSAPRLVRSVVVWGAFGALMDPDGEMVHFFDTVVDDPPNWGMQYHDKLLRLYGEEVARQSMKSAAAAMKTILDRGGDISRSRAEQIEAPVLLLAGEDDTFVPEPELRALAAQIRDCRVQVVPDAHHALHLDQPQVVANAIAAFYGEIRGRTVPA